MSVLAVLGGQSVRPSVFLYPLGVWVLMAVVAILNGGLREVVLIPRVGEYAGHVLSTGILVAAILLLSFLYFRGRRSLTRTWNCSSSAFCGRC